MLLLIFGVSRRIVAQIPIVPHKAALVLAPQGALVEQLAGDPFERALAEPTEQGDPETWCATWSMRSRRAKDERIKLMVLDLGSMTGGGIAKMEELAAAMRDFRATGKKVIAFGEAYDQAQYYLAAQADEIYLDPQGLVLIEGFGYYRTFLKGVIDKLRGRRERVPRRQVQVVHGSVQPQRHVGAGRAGEPGVAECAVERSIRRASPRRAASMQVRIAAYANQYARALAKAASRRSREPRRSTRTW